MNFKLALLLLCAIVAISASKVSEYTYSDIGCTADAAVAQSWEVGKCIGVGSQPPFKSSLKVHVDGSMAVFNYFTGGECATTSYQTTNQTLDQCKYYVGTLYTAFRLE